MDNLFNSVYDETSGIYRLSYADMFDKFTNNYWNLVLKYHLKQKISDEIITKVGYHLEKVH